MKSSKIGLYLSCALASILVTALLVAALVGWHPGCSGFDYAFSDFDPAKYCGVSKE
jgi:hypothetical protein